MRSIVMFVLATLTLGGCAQSLPKTVSPAAQAAPEAFGDARPTEYRIGPLDELRVTVFREPELSVSGAPVDSSGNILLPLVGMVRAEGLTAQELSTQIADRLRARYLTNPEVSVIVARSVSLRVTVDGQVRKPGVFPIEGRSTLLESLARAEGVNEVANLRDVFVFRTIDGRQYAARFDLRDIYSGRFPDPQMRGGDVVVVGVSRAKSIYQDFLKVAPFLGTVFLALNNN